jgi:hypothetical protein
VACRHKRGVGAKSPLVLGDRRNVSATRVVGVVGGGLVGATVAGHLSRAGHRVVVVDPQVAPVRTRVKRFGATVVDRVESAGPVDAWAVCAPSPHLALVQHAVDHRVPVVSALDDIDDVRAIMAAVARGVETPCVVGAAMAPGLTGLLARYLVDRLSSTEEIHVAIHGTGGPACARQHHRALAAPGIGWHDGKWIERTGGSGRELCWFPDPIGPHDCYRAGLPDPLLLHTAFPEVDRISARVSGTRRDRLTARLPMLTPPHPGGYEGAIRVEARGADEHGARRTTVLGAAGTAAELAAAVCSACVLSVVEGRFEPGVHVLGADSALSSVLLDRVLGLGVTLQEYTGDVRTADPAHESPVTDR